MKSRVPWGTVVPPSIRFTPFALIFVIHRVYFPVGCVNKRYAEATQLLSPNLRPAGSAVAVGEGDVPASDGLEHVPLADIVGVDVSDYEVVEEGSAEERLDVEGVESPVDRVPTLERLVHGDQRGVLGVWKEMYP